MWLSHVLRRNLARDPAGLALIDQRRAVSWRELARDVTALAATLDGAVPRGERVAILSANRAEVVEAYFACAVAGVVAVPVNPGLADPEIGYILNSTAPRLVLAGSPERERLGACLPGAPVPPAAAIEDVGGLPDAPDPDGLLARCAGLTEPAAILHTSATTGRPKGVVVDQRSFQLNALSWLADTEVPAGTRFLNACPLFHGSMVIALDYLAAGATVCVLDRFTPAACLAALESWRIQHAFLVPSMIRLLLESRALAGADASALRLVAHGAAPMPAGLAEQARARLGTDLLTIFGITEGGGPAICLRPGDKPGEPPVPGAACAGFPMLGTDVRVVGAGGGPAAPGEVGEIHLRGDGLMHGYWQDPGATAEAVAGGWLNTRDLGCLDAGGYLWSVDRRNDLILRGGQNVYPAEIEHVLRQAPDVADVAVVPAASAAWGQTPVAFIEPAAAAAVDEGGLIGRCVSELASYKRPSRFVIIDRVPRNPAGKILRARLREQAERLTAGDQQTGESAQ